MIIGGREFSDEGRVYVMGILNVTPDSFSDGGRYCSADEALVQAEKMIAEGADIIDIGGESTRPGYVPVGSDEEVRRLMPVITAIKKSFDIPVSVDTYHSDVAKLALEAGADMINDIWGLKYSENTFKMEDVIKEYGVSVCVMHNAVNETQSIDEVINGLEISLAIAKGAGIPEDRIMIDPGVGFAKSYEMNMAVISNLAEFRKLGYPVLLGASRKSVIGLTLDLPADERAEGTIVTSVFAALSGCSFVRVHDIKENVRALRMTEALRNYRL